MPTEQIEADFKRKVSDEIRLQSEGVDRFRVFTPFMFEDGDHLAVVLKKIADNWILSDEGHTYMHLTYDIEESDLRKGTRQKVITNALSAFHVNDNDGELTFKISGDAFGDSLFSYVQALLKISDVSFLSREKVRSTFVEDFQSFILSKIPSERITFGWHDPERDPEGKYPVDCYVNGMNRPLFIYALNSDDKVRDATISILQFEKLDFHFRPVGIFEDQETINGRVLARFSDVCEKLFSNISGGNRDRIEKYLHENVTGLASNS